MTPTNIKVIVDPANRLIGLTIAEQPQLVVDPSEARQIADVLLTAARIAEDLASATLQ